MINSAYNRVTSLILKNQGQWQYDDSNQTDLPVATTALVSGQQDYSLPVTFLTLERVELLPNGGSAGDWVRLKQIDQQLMKRDRDTSLTAYESTNGQPAEYDLIGNSAFLYPASDYSQAASLKFFFSRGPAEFTSAEVSTGTKVPGFNSLFHELIPLWVSYNYAVENLQPTANGFLAEIQRKEIELENFYGLRDRDTNRGFIVSTDSNR